jgi:hypothetical protein
MNESEIEDQLRSIAPAAPSGDLRRRIAGELAVPPPECTSWWADLLRQIAPPLGWASVGAAATLAVLSSSGLLERVPAQSPGFTTAPPAAETFQRVASSRELVRAFDEGVLYSENGEPSRRVRATSIERHAWTNPATGARLEVEVPREDIILTSLPLQ